MQGDEKDEDKRLEKEDNQFEDEEGYCEFTLFFKRTPPLAAGIALPISRPPTSEPKWDYDGFDSLDETDEYEEDMEVL